MVQLRYLIFNWYNPKQFVFKKVSNKNWNCIFDSFRTGIDTFSEMLSFVAKYVLFLQKSVVFGKKNFKTFCQKQNFFKTVTQLKKHWLQKGYWDFLYLSWVSMVVLIVLSCGYTAFQICLDTQQLTRLLTKKICIFFNVRCQIIAEVKLSSPHLCKK